MSWLDRVRRPPGRDPYPCNDCGMLTAPEGAPDEWYEVRDEVWLAAGMTVQGILCIGCLENRLGRELSARDFENAALNDPAFGWHSDRLNDRLRRAEPPATQLRLG